VALDIRLGCMNRPWTWFPFERALQGIAAAGFSHFGLLRHGGGPRRFGGRLLIAPETSAEEAQAVAATIQRHGLQLLMLPNFVQLQGSDEDALSATQRQIDHCVRLGVRVLLEMGHGRPEAYERYFALMRRAAPYAAERGVVIALKPHGGLSNTGADTLAAVRRVNHPAFRICFDPGNLLRAGDSRPHDHLPTLAPYVVALCIKDATRGPSGTDHITPGDGEVDFRAIMRCLRDHGFSGPALVETLAAGDTPEAVDASARRAFTFLSELLAP